MQQPAYVDESHDEVNFPSNGALDDGPSLSVESHLQPTKIASLHIRKNLGPTYVLLMNFEEL